MYFSLKGISEGDNEHNSFNKDKLFTRKVADIIPKVCGNLKQFSTREDMAKAKNPDYYESPRYD